MAAGLLGIYRTARLAAARRAILVTSFNEWVFLRGFLSWVSGRYSVAWAQERSTRRLEEDEELP